ncbi:MAG: tyrosine-type recombinase/integrase [Fibrobacteres bacterium]|nr:tyrosine-type recombinase/integrase [Fibrobacterota bacterium]
MELQNAQSEFLKYIRLEKAFSENTFLAYKAETGKLISSLQKEGLITIEEVDRFHLTDFTRSLDMLQISSKSRAIAVIRSFFGFLRELELLQTNPAEFISQPKIPRKMPVFLSEEDSRALLRTVLRTATPFYKMRDYTIIALFLNTGIRLSELCGIRVRDLDLITPQICITRKGNKQAYIYLDESLVSFVKRWLKDRRGYKNSEKSDFLFLSKWGNQICGATVIETVKKYAIFAGLVKDGGHQITPHKLRHSFGSRLLSKGENLRTIQELLGHSSITSTQIYTHITEINLRKTIERQSI